MQALLLRLLRYAVHVLILRFVVSPSCPKVISTGPKIQLDLVTFNPLVSRCINEEKTAMLVD